MQSLRILLLTVALAFSSSSIKARSAEGKTSLPSGVTCEQIGTYSVARLNEILTKEVPAQLSDYPVNYEPARASMRLYRITYRSVIPELGNKPTVASGLLAILFLPIPMPQWRRG